MRASYVSDGATSGAQVAAAAVDSAGNEVLRVALLRVAAIRVADARITDARGSFYRFASGDGRHIQRLRSERFAAEWKYAMRESLEDTPRNRSLSVRLKNRDAAMIDLQQP